MPRLTLLGAVYSFTVLAACGGTSEDRSPVEIGVVATLSGDLSQFGIGANNSIILAVNEINDAGGVLGRPLKLFIRDDGTTPEGSSVAYGTVLNRGVPVVLGPVYSGGVLAVEDQIRTGRTLTLSGSATSPELTTLSDDGFFFRTVSSDATQGIVLAQLITQTQRANVCLVYRDDSYGVGLAAALKASLASGVTIVESKYNPAAPSLARVLDPCDSVLTAERPGLALISFEGDGIVLLDDAAGRGWSASAHGVFLVDGNQSQTLVDALADPAAIEGALGTAPSGPDVGTPAGALLRAFQNRYMASFGEATGTNAENTYDATYLAATAIQIAGGTDDRVAVRDAIAATASGPSVNVGEWAEILAAVEDANMVNLEGTSGGLTFDDNGDLSPPWHISVWTVRGGKIEEDRVVVIEQ